MSTKSKSQVSKISKAKGEAKEIKETKTKIAVPRLTEEEKAADTENYIYNASSKKHVKRDGQMGKKLVEAEKTGKEVAKTMTETQRLVLMVQTLVDQLGLDDASIKAALCADESVKAELPRGFPAHWGGKMKTARHPDHPKNANNAYIYFIKAIRASVVLANPGVKNTEIISIMAKQWKDTAEADRKEYNDLAIADKERYHAEMKIFETEHPEEARSKTSPGNGKPTKETAYHLFSEEKREALNAEFPDLDGKQITKKLAEIWDDLKKSDKDMVTEYQAMADKANEGFEERVTEYHTSPGSSPKLSKVEQAKADDPEHYELNSKTNRYVLKEGWKKNPDGTFVKKESGSPKTKAVAKPTAKKSTTKPAEKKISKPAEKKVAKPVAKKEEDEDEDLLV